MPDRVRCLVPHCRRTAPADRYPAGYEIICARHWRAVPRALKACYRRARAAERAAADVDRASLVRLQAAVDAGARAAYPAMLPAEADRWRAVDRHVKASSRSRRLWRACRRKAIEAAGGIG